MEISAIALNQAGKLATKKTLDIISEQYQSRLKKRVDSFLECIDLSYDRITGKNFNKFEKYINSEEGKEILASFVEAVCKTSCRRAHMALAMIYCKDPDISLDYIATKILIKALDSIDDETIDFFIKSIDDAEYAAKNIETSRCVIHENNFRKFNLHDWGQAGVNVFINELINKRLLVPDPTPNAMGSTEHGTWSVCYGVSPMSLKFKKVFVKAQELIDSFS